MYAGTASPARRSPSQADPVHGPAPRVARCAGAGCISPPVAAAERTGLDLAGVDRDGEVGDGRVLGLTRAMADDRGVAGAVRGADRVEGFAEGPDLVQLDEDRVRHALLDAAREALLVRDEDVVADDLDF